MKVLLSQDVKKLGKAGEIVDVSDGYAKNFILPKKLGIEATAKVLNEWKLKKGSEANRKEQERQQALALVQEMKEWTVVLKEKAGQDGRLFGSVTSKDIAQAVKEQYGTDIDRKKILLKDPLRAVGGYSVEVRLQAEAVGQLSVMIQPLE